MKGAEMVVKSLMEEGVRVVFGYPGGAVLGLYDALSRSSIRHILVRHEQGAAHAADGYARASGKPGVCLATSGPGGTNLVTGLAAAYMDSIPVVAITGQVPVEMIGRDAFQEADLTGITIPITKHNYLVKRIEDVPRVIKEAFYIASTGRPGPVLVDLPRDVMDAQGEYRVPSSLRLPGYKPNIKGHPSQIAKAANAINNSKRPLLLLGGGAVGSNCAPEAKELAETADIPVVATFRGLGSFPGDHPLWTGMIGIHGLYAANKAVMEADLIIGVGLRFDERATGKADSFAPHATIIHIDIDPAEIGKNVRADIPIVGDAKIVLEELLPRVSAKARKEWREQIEAWRRQSKPRSAISQPGSQGSRTTGVDPIEAVDIMARTLAEVRPGTDPVIVTDVGQHQMWMAQAFPFKTPRSLISSGGLGSMGYGLPAAVGAQLAAPDRTVVAVLGDGGFQMTQQELATISCYGLPVKLVVLNNGVLGMVRQLQHFLVNGRYTSVELLGNPDFAALAHAYSIRAWRANSPEDLRKAFGEALLHRGPALVDVVIPQDALVLPMVAPGKPLDQMIF